MLGAHDARGRRDGSFRRARETRAPPRSPTTALAHDARGIAFGVRDHAARDFRAVAAERRSRCRRARIGRVTPTTPAGSRLLPAAQRLQRARVDDEAPARAQRSGDPLLARALGVRRWARTSCNRAPSSSRRDRVHRRAGRDGTCGSRRPSAILAAMILVAMPPDPTSDTEPPGHGFDLGRDVADFALDEPGVGIEIRIRRVQADPHPTAAAGSRRSPSARRVRRAGRCRRSGSRSSPRCRFR